MNLEQLRQEIDALDGELLSLLLRRMEITRQVAAYKVENHLPVLNQGREQDVLHQVAKKAGEYGDGMKIIFSTIMDVSRADQHQVMGGGQALRQTLAEAKQMDFNHFSGKVACPGVPGAYSSEAARQMFPAGELAYYTGFEDVFLAVESGAVEFGVVPVENSTSGSVHETYDHIMKYRFSIGRAYDLPISHCLCAPPGVQLADLRRVYSKAEGLAQCNDYLKAHYLEPVPYSNTAAAAEYLSKSGLPDSGAICSRHAAQVYGLCVLDDKIQISDSNTTRFIAIARTCIINPDADKISLIFAIPHVTGSLYKVLSQFSMYGLNLTKLESRPHRTSGFRYHFYLDLAGHVRDTKTADLLCALSADLPEFTFLGNFKEDV